jgi:hypothetical protein
MQQRGRSALPMRLRAFEVHGNATLPRPDVRTLETRIVRPRVGGPKISIYRNLRKSWYIVEKKLTVSTESTLHHLHEILQ